MSAWSEDEIRKAASWQAFKQGREWADAGAVSGAKASADGWSGLVMEGRKRVRCRAVIDGPTRVEARCPCPANQSRGEFCAHAVAVGLALLKEPVEEQEPIRPAVPMAATGESQAWRVEWPGPWGKLLRQGRMALRVVPLPGEAASLADRRLTAWLAGQIPGGCSGPQSLHIDGERLGGCLDALMDHPRIVDGEGLAVEVLPGGRLGLDQVEKIDGVVRVVADSCEWVMAGKACWLVGTGTVRRIESGGMELPGWSRLLSQGEVRLPAHEFLAHLDVWNDRVVFPVGCWLHSLRFLPVAPKVVLELDKGAGGLHARLMVHYGNRCVAAAAPGAWPDLPRLDGDLCLIRDIDAERDAVRCLRGHGFAPVDDAWVLRDPQATALFLTDTSNSSNGPWDIVESSAVSRARRDVDVISPELQVTASGEDWLEFNLKFKTSDGSDLSRSDLQAILRGAGPRSKAVIHPSINHLIEPLVGELDLDQFGGGFRASRAAAEVFSQICKKDQKSLYSNNQERLKKFEIPSTFEANLRPYQEQGAGWLWDRVQRYGGALLADDMGLGKTVQTIAMVERLMGELVEDSGVALVVVTTSLLGNWRAEWERFAGGRRVWVMHGAQRDRLRERVGAGDVVLTSYGTLVRDRAWHLSRAYRVVVADEASLMRNPDTDHAKMMARMVATARVALTGTPVENGVRDLWSIFRFIQPGWLGSRRGFEQAYSGLVGGQASGLEMERLRMRVSPFVLRRTKEQVAADLPAKWVMDEYCDLTSDQQSVYRGLLEEGRRQVDKLAGAGQQGAARMQVLTALLRLRQACGDLALLNDEKFGSWAVEKRSAKLQRLLELLEGAVAGGHRVLVFSQFQRQLVQIERELEAAGISSLRLDGQTSNRQQLVDRFQSPDGPSVFLISLKAGGYGLNLTAADVVIHFDPWWNPAAEAQATDRAHRIGQQRPVTVYRLLTRGTVEEKVVRLQARKREVAAAIDEAGSGDAGGWTTTELGELLGDA